MKLQSQLRRGMVALAIWTVLGAVAIERLAGGVDASAAGAQVEAQTSPAACSAGLRIDLNPGLRVTFPCAWSCAPVRSVMHVLHVPVRTAWAVCAPSSSA